MQVVCSPRTSLGRKEAPTSILFGCPFQDAQWSFHTFRTYVLLTCSTLLSYLNYIGQPGSLLSGLAYTSIYIALSMSVRFLECLSESGGGEDTLTTKKKLRKLDHTIIKAHVEYGALYNETAPVLNLPTEILCQIFEDTQDASRMHRASRHPCVEVIISHVCRGWRSVALSFPPLWSTFRHDSICDQTHRQLGSRLDVYLDRSGSHLLDLYFHFGYSTRSTGSFKSMLENTLPHVARWRRFFSISNDAEPRLDFSDRLSRLEAPNLEYLSLGPATLHPGTFLRDTPKLCYLRMDTPCPSQYFPLLSNITMLRIERHSDSGRSRLGSWNDFLEILALPSLSSLSIFGQHFSKSESQHSSNIIMKNLKHLHFGENNLFRHFFPLLSAPLLETLALCDLHSPFPDLMDREPFYMLHSLTVICCPHLFLKLAAITPSVTHLTVSESYPPKCMTELFNKGGTNLWAKLKVLSGKIYEHGRRFSFYHEFAQMMANPDLIIRISASYIKEWAREFKMAQLQAMCVLEEMPVGGIPWPPGADVPVETDFFSVNYY